MKKILSLSLLALTLLAACKEEAPHYLITGKVVEGDMNGKTVYLKQLEKMRPTKVVDSAIIDKGALTIKNTVATPDLYVMSIKDENAVNLRLFVENAPMQVTFDLKEAKNTKATGSPLNDLFNKYNTEVFEKFLTERDAFVKKVEEEVQATPDKKATEEMMARFDKEYKPIDSTFKASQKKFLTDNPNSIVSAYILRTIAGGLEPDEVESYLVKFDTVVSKSFFITSIKEELEVAKKTVVGQMFTDVKLQNPEGKEVALSDYAGKGKYVLVDFWASWCGPCRAENPNVVALYNKYKNSDFEIVGISLDRTKEDWTKGIADDKITWPQMSDLKAWGSEGAKLYNVKSIPHTVLLDKDGKIMARGLHGEELAAKIAELLDKK